MKNLIEVSHVSKSYGKVQALRDVSFSVKQGELFGLIGPARSREKYPVPHPDHLAATGPGKCPGTGCGCTGRLPYDTAERRVHAGALLSVSGPQGEPAFLCRVFIRPLKKTTSGYAPFMNRLPPSSSVGQVHCREE